MPDQELMEQLQKEAVSLRERVATLEAIVKGIEGRAGLIQDLHEIKEEQKTFKVILQNIEKTVVSNKTDYELNNASFKGYLKGAGFILIVAETINIIFQTIQYLK